MENVCHVASKCHSLEAQNEKMKETVVNLAVGLIQRQEEVDMLKMKEKIGNEPGTSEEEQNGDMLEVSITK